MVRDAGFDAIHRRRADTSLSSTGKRVSAHKNVTGLWFQKTRKSMGHLPTAYLSALFFVKHIRVSEKRQRRSG